MKKHLKNWNLFEILWLLVFSGIGIGLNILWHENWLGFGVFLTGVLCVVLAAKGSIWTYIYGTVNTIGYAYVSYKNGLYGETGLYILFFLPMNIVGFIMWKNKMNGTIVKMRELAWKWRIVTIVICCVAIALTGLGLSQIKGQNNPFIDATTVVISIVATFLMVWRYKEQWVLYIVLNIFTIILWIIRMINGSKDGPVMIVMWSAFLINAVYGLYIWDKGAKLAAKGDKNG